jgi:hypothetical protein
MQYHELYNTIIKMCVGEEGREEKGREREREREKNAKK